MTQRERLEKAVADAQAAVTYNGVLRDTANGLRNWVHTWLQIKGTKKCDSDGNEVGSGGTTCIYLQLNELGTNQLSDADKNSFSALGISLATQVNNAESELIKAINALAAKLPELNAAVNKAQEALNNYAVNDPDTIKAKGISQAMVTEAESKAKQRKIITIGIVVVIVAVAVIWYFKK